MNDQTRPTRQLSPAEVDAMRRELAAADPNNEYRAASDRWTRSDDTRHPVDRTYLPTDSTPSRPAERTGILLAAIVAFWGTVALAAWGDNPAIRGIGAFVGIVLVVSLVVFAVVDGGDQ